MPPSVGRRAWAVGGDSFTIVSGCEVGRAGWSISQRHLSLGWLLHGLVPLEGAVGAMVQMLAKFGLA
ncbi:protein of unknown function [Streptomyces sp. KY70]|nr:protein of unknown function [Streptomyces sp. KY70]